MRESSNRAETHIQAMIFFFDSYVNDRLREGNGHMKKMIFYSHDTYGLGNLRRTMSICQYLMDTLSDLSILIISGSPMIQSFRIPHGIDYVKLPCLTRTTRDGYTSKFLDDEARHLFKLRSDIILCSVANFKPDLMMVDKKPFGVQNELCATLSYMQEHLPETKLSLILRDILDSPEITQDIWRRHSYVDALEQYYDEICVLGSPLVFDPRTEYAFPPSLRAKTKFWGYIRREPGLKDPSTLRQELGVPNQGPLVLVTAGGGEDGTHLFEQVINAQDHLPSSQRLKTLMILGPEMPTAHRTQLRHEASRFGNIVTMDFTDDLMSYMAASDLVISMGGYGTMCEILTLKKPAIIVPRCQPVQEQLIRARRMADLGLVRMIHPQTLTPQALATAMQATLQELPKTAPASPALSLDALACIADSVSQLSPRRLRNQACTMRWGLESSTFSALAHILA